MKDDILLIFVGLVFLTVFFLSQVLILPTFGTSRVERKKLQHRFDKILHGQDITHQQIVKKKYLQELNGFERFFESMPIMMGLKLYLEQASIQMPAYRFIFCLLSIGILTGITAKNYYDHPIVVVLAFLIIFLVAYLWISKRREKNIDKFDEQLPEALEMIARSLKTGYPFIECLKIVADEMPDPIALEFGRVFEDINFGRDLEIALALMIERVPSLSLNAMATSVLIQKQTGGNMAEILEKISEVLRSRFKLQRRVKTLSAEGVFSAWVIALVPFFMYFGLTLINPNHFDALYEHPKGIYLFYVIAVLEIIAVFWMRKIIHIDI